MKKIKKVWIIIGNSHSYQIVDRSGLNKGFPYEMCISKSPTIFSSYRKAYNCFRRQIRSYNNMIKKDFTMRKQCRIWKSELQIIGINLNEKIV
jgi:hypothetical protein